MPPVPRRHGLLLLVAAVTALAVAAPRPAAADIRVWETGGPDPEAQRYLELTGFLQPGYIWRQSDPNSPITDSLFWLQRARLGVKTVAHPQLFTRLEVELTPNPALQDAYVEWRPSRLFRLRAGQFLVPYLYTFQFDESNLAFNDRVLYVPQSPDRAALRYLSPRDIGVMANGFIGPFERAPRLPIAEYRIAMMVGRGPNQIRNTSKTYLYAGRLRLHLNGVPEGSEDESDIAKNDRPRVAIGGGIYSNCDDRGQWNRGYTFDAELRYRGLFANATLVRIHNGAANGIGSDLYGGSCPGVPGVGGNIAVGASAQVQYRLPPRLFPLRTQALEVLVRWDYVSPMAPNDGSFLGGGPGNPNYIPPTSYGDADNPPTQWRLTFGLNWFPTATQRLRLTLNYQMNRQTEHVFISGQEIAGIHNDIVWLQLTLAL